MYRYDAVDRLIVEERVAQFRDQTERYLAGLIDEDAFKPLRLQNGLYIQRYAPMLRIAIPYGVLSSDQLRALAAISRRYDRGYGHFTTRQNIQFNWVKVEEVPDILADLAKISMHAIQTSGSCVRNVTTDALRGRRRRRDRRSASVLRADAAMVDAASRVRASAAQVQSRVQRRQGRSRRHAGARSGVRSLPRRCGRSAG